MIISVRMLITALVMARTQRLMHVPSSVGCQRFSCGEQLKMGGRKMATWKAEMMRITAHTVRVNVGDTPYAPKIRMYSNKMDVLTKNKRGAYMA